MVTKLGIGSLIAGFFLAVFSGISNFMNARNFAVNLTLSKVFGEDTTESIITTFDSEFLQNALDTFFYEIPFFGILLIFGVILLIISHFLKNH